MRVFLLLVFFLSLLQAEERIVATADEIPAVMKKAKPGDVITFAAGEWSNADILLECDGTKELPILIRAEQPGRVIFTGNSRMHIAGTYMVVDGFLFRKGTPKKGDVIEFRGGKKKESSFCRLTNCAIVDYNPPDKETDYKWVSVYGVSNRVDHNYFSGKNHQGTLLAVWLSDQPNYHLIDHNYFGHRPHHYQNGAEIIRVGDSKSSMQNSRTTVEYNFFQECDGEYEIISNKSCENSYRYNTFMICQGTLTLRHGNRCTVEGNFFFGNHKPKTGGVRIIGEDHRVFNNYFADLEGDQRYAALSMMNGVVNSAPNGYFQVKNAQVVFNTFINNRHSILIGVMGSDPSASLPPLDCTIANNVVKTSDGYLIEELSMPVNLKFEANVLDGPVSGVKAQEDVILQEVLVAPGNDELWRPTISSPAIGAAVGIYDFVKDDMDGQLRGEKKDIGADQVLNSGVIRRPLTPVDVGPRWLKR